MSQSRLYKFFDMKKMPWKNGGGFSSEVAISPAGAELGRLDFDWRVSIAEIDAHGPFSPFPGYDRQLAVWKGEGISINGVEHLAMRPFQFIGEIPIEARLIQDQVKDFGVIFKRGKFTSLMTAHKLAAEESSALEFSGDECFVLCTRGELRIGEFYLNPGDVFHTSEPGAIQVKALERSDFLRVTLSQI
ncbi:MAG: HutD family protein [Bdellovibrionota bacterium]